MKKNKGMTALRVVAALLIVALAAAVGVSASYLKKEKDRKTFFDRTYINGYAVAGLTPDEVKELLIADYSAPQITLNENGSAAISGSLADFGYTINEKKLDNLLAQALTTQKSSFLVLIESLMNGNNFELSVPFSYDEKVLDQKVNASALPTQRKKSVDASLEFDEKKSEYYIKPEVYGNEFDDAQLQQYVNAQIEALASGVKPGSNITIDFPEDIYFKPEITQDDAALNSQANMYNQYSKAKITYVFGSQTEVLDWSTIKDWLIIEDGTAMIRQDSIAEYVDSLAARYNTRYYDRTFVTSYGNEIHIPGDLNTYGYLVNESGEEAQLLADIQANTATEREPVYYTLSDDGYNTPVFHARDGRDDLAGTYIEVSISAQHLWFYKDGALIVESDVVTGDVTKKHDTHTGVYPIAFKESPSTLSGQDGPNGYEVKVNYWMPFADGQGFHDASWRSSFGGQIYVTNGSHGCVNLPPSVAGTIFNNVDAGVAVIIY